MVLRPNGTCLAYSYKVKSANRLFDGILDILRLCRFFELQGYYVTLEYNQLSRGRKVMANFQMLLALFLKLF